MSKKTVGQEAVERLLNPDTKQGIVDTQREIDKEYFDEINKCIDNHKDWTRPYYIVVHLKKERLLENVIRRYFIGRQSLPTPQWDQTAWRYTPKTGDLRFLWVLPDQDTAKWMASNPNEIEKDDIDLLRYTTALLDGTLFRDFKALFHKEDEKQTKTIGMKK